MKLFEFHGNPTGNEDELRFETKPGTELKNQLSESWIAKLNEEVMQSFVEIMQKKDQDINNDYFNLLRIGIRGRNVNDGVQFETDLYQRDAMLGMIENFNETQLNTFQILNNKFTQDITELFIDYMDTIMHLANYSDGEVKEK